MIEKDLTRPLRDFIAPVRTTIHVEHTVEEALRYLRNKHITDEIIYIYVVDEERKLIGIVPTRRLILADPETLITEIMSSRLVSLKGDQTLRDAMEFLESHHLLALPVVDDKNHLLGVIDVGLYLEEKVNVATARCRADIFQMIGMYIEEGKRPSPWKGYRSRMPWIFCNMFGGFACAVISRVFEIVLAKVLLLAMFIPLVLTLSESISMQSMAQSMQLLKKNHRTWKYTLESLFREWYVVVLLAITSGIIVGSVSLLWGDGILPGFVIMFGIMISVYITATIGSVVPLIVHARKWDPRVAAGPVVLMFADVLTTLFYLSLGTWWLL
ncbi:MAG: CBS domain-containing protein [Candidatus Neptunochlamydia sp.]|nr:CBS domain-containing protein [Candidatus Neptunochlamydia sp.]